MKKTAAITGHSVIAAVRFIYGISLPLLKKPNEEREFSEKELEQIKQAALQDITNPRAVMILFSMETGMRAGELASVKTNDVNYLVILSIFFMTRLADQ